MSRSERLLQLLEILRRYRYPVTAQILAEELRISVRTLYRDIASLQKQGCEIEGEAGLGYVLKAGFTLPPLMFSEDEIEALILGSRFVAGRTDAPFAKAAHSAITKILAVLPAELRLKSENSTLLIGPTKTKKNAQFLSLSRLAIREQRKLKIFYKDIKDQETNRIIWPFGIAFFDNSCMILAFCEERNAYRHFRVDRMIDLQKLEERIPRRKHDLMIEWRSHLQLSPEMLKAVGNH